MLALRLTNALTLDAVFGSGGYATIGFAPAGGSSTDEPDAIALAAGGLIIAGYTTIPVGLIDEESRFTQAKLRIDLIFANGFD